MGKRRERAGLFNDRVPVLGEKRRGKASRVKRRVEG